MKAKCPHCLTGCDKCEDGFIQVSFAVGSIFTRKCRNPDCEFENGGRVSVGVPLGLSNACVICGAPTAWVKICDQFGVEESKEQK
jgi:hypothetical protein